MQAVVIVVVTAVVVGLIPLGLQSRRGVAHVHHLCFLVLRLRWESTGWWRGWGHLA